MAVTVDDAHGDAVDGVVEWGHVDAFGLRGDGYFIVVGAEDEEAGAGFHLLLAYELLYLLFHGLVGDVDYAELLAVVAGGGVAYGVVDEVQLVLGEGLALVAAHAHAVEKRFFYGLHMAEMDGL